MSEQYEEHPYCPISRQKCRQGKVYANPEANLDLVYCAFWHQ